LFTGKRNDYNRATDGVQTIGRSERLPRHAYTDEGWKKLEVGKTKKIMQISKS
jgi:hypothetical protein